jgi:hypothetical protein
MWVSGFLHSTRLVASLPCPDDLVQSGIFLLEDTNGFQGFGYIAGECAESMMQAVVLKLEHG